MENFKLIEQEGKLENFKELKEYLQYNKYIVNDLASVSGDVKKILYFKEDGLYLVYQNKTFEEVYNECIKKLQENISN